MFLYDQNWMRDEDGEEEKIRSLWNESSGKVLRPDIERLVVDGKNAEEDLLQRPLGAVIP